MESRKIKLSLIGMGKVGASIAYTIMIKGLADHMVLVNRRRHIAEGEAYDLLHALPFSQPMEIRPGDIFDTAGSDIVVVSASIPSKNMKDRMDLGEGNTRLFEKLIPSIAEASPQAVLIIVTNPVDLMTYWTWKLSGFPPSRVIGTGTLIDSARFRSLLGETSGIHPSDIHAYILGEHGESEFAALSIADVGGKPIHEIIPLCIKDCSAHTVEGIFEEARDGGFKVYRHKGYTNHAIALATAEIIETVVRDRNRVLPVSTLMKGYLGVHDVCLSLPAIVGRNGVKHLVELDLDDEEKHAFQKSAERVKTVARSLGIL